jgi:hypothetical protein
MDFKDFKRFAEELHDNEPCDFESQGIGKFRKPIQTNVTEVIVKDDGEIEVVEHERC